MLRILRIVVDVCSLLGCYAKCSSMHVRPGQAHFFSASHLYELVGICLDSAVN